MITEGVRYSANELSTIASKFGGKPPKTADTTINLSTTDSKVLHVNIKTSDIKLEDNKKLGHQVLGKIVKVVPLQLGKNAEGKGKTLDDILDEMSDPKTITAVNVESFFYKLKEAYHNNNKENVLRMVEAAYHGFTYGAVILNYHTKYGVDTYVEQSAGRGFLDLYFLLRKNNGNDVPNAVKIIVEFKGAQRKGSNSIMSVTDAVKQIEENAYAFQFVGRTESQNVIIVGADFGATGETVQAKESKIDLPEQSFISKLIDARQATLDHTTIKQELKTIYDSTRSDEPLDKVILGDLLSSNVVEKNVFIIKDFPNGQRVSMFVFKNQYQKAVILTCIEQENLASPKYVRAILKDPSKPAIRANIKKYKQITIEQEVNDGILYIQRELNINSGKRIDITINPKGKVFESIRSADFYCLDIKVKDLALALSSPAPYILPFITKYDIASSIDLNNLIPALQGLDLEHMSSPPHDDGDKQAQREEFQKLKKELFNLKEFVALERDLKSILHGLFLNKKFNEQDITILTETSLGHGRADLALIFKDNIPLALELGLGTLETAIIKKQLQLKGYIKYLKAITDARQAHGVVLGFNKDATSADSIIVAKDFSDMVDHISSDDSPIRQPSLQSSPNLQDLDNPQPGPSGVQQKKRGYNSDSDSKLNPSQKKLKGSLSSCPDSKKKREISFCKFSAQDLDEFSIKKTRNIDELQIDSKKFLEYLQHSNDQAKNSQLLELAKIRQIEDSDNIIGNYKYLLDRVTEAGGYNNYRQNARLESIMYNIARDHSIKINNQLKSTLISAAGKIQLIMGIHGAIVQCQESKDSDTEVQDCLLSVGGLTYSLASAPIENIIVKQQSKWGVRLLNSFSQVKPKILGHNTKFMFKILSEKYGLKFFKGTAGVVTGVFDIVDIGLAAQALKKCQDNAGTDNACSNKDIRDYTASIIFSGVSFVSGIALIVANATIGINVVVGVALMVAYALYGGISAIVEYEAKYDTTDDENWRIFWHTVVGQPLPMDIQYLEARTALVNNILNTSWHHLQSMPDNVVAYAGGFGQIVIQNWQDLCRKFDGSKMLQILTQRFTHPITSVLCTYSSSTVEPSYAIINMLHNNSHDLSRILPNHIAGATMTCLPQRSHKIYEARGTGRSDPNVIYLCNNGFVVEHNARRNQVHDHKYIIFNTQLMSSGEIITHNTLSSIFFLGKSAISIYVLSHHSQFIFLDNEFSGSITFIAPFSRTWPLPHSLNKSFNAVFNTAMLDYNIVKFSIKSITHLHLFLQHINLINIFINDKKITLCSYYHDVIKIAYHGRKNKADHVDCKLDDNYPSVEFDLIDGDGGYSNDRPDIMTGCKKVVIWPYTEVKGTEGIYHFYIRTRDVKKENLNSLIDIKGTGTIVFLDTNLLTDCEKITYSKENNTLSLQIKLGANTFYTLSIKNYLGSDDLTHNFNLIDKNSGTVIPKIAESTTIISRLELHITKERSSGQNGFSVEEVKKYYEKVSEKKKDYELYGVVQDKESYYHFGSKGADIIIFDKQIAFAKGGEESDVYIVTNNIDVGTIIIDNSSHDMKFDILVLSSTDDVWLETAGNDLNILIHKKKDDMEKVDSVIIYNYFKDISYKHLIFVDEKGDTYIPFQGVDNNLRLVSFSSCTSSFISVITASTTAVIDCELDDIEYYRIQEDLILHSRSSNSPVIIAKQLFDNQVKYNDTKIYQYNHNAQPLDVIGGANRAKDYKQLVQESYNVVIQEYEIDFSRSFNITHNHRMENGKLVPIPVDEQRIGVIIFKDIKLVQIKVTRFADDLVISDFFYVHSDEQPIIRIKNWFINHDYAISTIEFDLGLDSIRINKWDKNTNTIKGDTTLDIMQNKISLAEWMTNNPSVCIQALLSPNCDILYHHLKCIIAINSKNNIIKSYEALGFNVPEEQVTFIDHCAFTKDVLLQLKRALNTTAEYEHCVGCNRAVLPPPNMGNNVLACEAWHRLILRGYNYIEASQIYNNISQIFNYSRIIESIDKIQNILGNNSDEADHQRHRRSFNDHENLIISTTNWFKEKVYPFWNMIGNFNILPVANAEPINENPNIHSIAVQYDYVQQQLPLIQYVLHHSQLVPTVKKYGVIGTIKYFIRQCENRLSNWYYHQDTGPDPDEEQFSKQICSCTNWLNKLESILIEMRTQLIKSQMSSVFVQCVSEKENIKPKHKLLNYVESALQGEIDSRLLNNIETKLGKLGTRWQKKYKVLKSYQDSIQDTKDELYQLTVKLQQQKTVTQNQIDEITILVNYTTDLTIGIMDLTNNSVLRQQLQQLLLVNKYGINKQQDAVGERVELNISNVDINISAGGDMDYRVLAYMSHILPDQLVMGSSGEPEPLILAC
ncbi:hypothetical protein ACE5D9_01805 [Rickettsia sp. 2024-CO-Wats]|uniref:hypothetical protein n=1 Tax=unclassified Rickettsia TaxID=114295 RepID=UPI00370D6CF1